MNIRHVYRGSLLARVQTVARRPYASTADEIPEALDISSVTETPVFEKSVTEAAEIRLANIRNKSRLNPEHRSILLGQRPYHKSMEWYHDTVRYKKRMLGRYGLSALDVTPGVAWPTPEQVADVKEYERVAFPRTIQEEWEIIKKNKEEQKAKIMARERQVAEKMAQVQGWIDRVQKKIEDRERQKREAREIREKIISEVKKELGINYDRYDEEFIELIAKKEKEYKKKMKQQKKVAKDEKKKKIVESVSMAPQMKSEKAEVVEE